MLAPWVIEETKDVDLNDKRLNDRLTVILDQLGGHPTASIPAACGGSAELAAAYRFFDNEKVGFENILQPHIEASGKRMAQQPVVILAQDTTEINLTRPEQQVIGAGPLDGDTRRGAFLHPLMGFTPDGTPLGLVSAEVWTRGDEAPLPKSQREAKRTHTPIEEKESVRWLDTFRLAREQAERIPKTQFICVADSEADIYEVLQESLEEPQQLDWITRACQDRTLKKDDETGANRLRDRVLTEEVLFTKTISVHDRKLREISVNVVLVTEIDPPANDVPVEWILLTSLPIDDMEQVWTVVQYYCVRWMIEVFFRTLKSGCRVEGRRFEHMDRVLPCLAVYLIVTWRTLYVCRLGREFPEISCEAVFEPAEWKSVHHFLHKKPPPPTPPSPGYPLWAAFYS